MMSVSLGWRIGGGTVDLLLDKILNVFLVDTYVVGLWKISAVMVRI